MYALGIDIGTTFTAAAVHQDGFVETVPLGTHRAAVPSLVAFLGDESSVVGEAAERRARTAPDRVARGFKRRFGDATPIIVGGSPRSAEQLTARLLQWTIEQVAEARGGRPDSITVTHPASWSRYKLDALDQAFVLAGEHGVSTLSEPVAAAVDYASHSRVPEDARLLVYDLGGGTFDVAVVDKSGGSFTLLGEPKGIERLGGMDFDAAVLAWARRELGPAGEHLRADDPEAYRLRAECVAVKEALSADTEGVIATTVGGEEHVLRLTRAMFEDLVRPTLADTMVSVRDALDAARLGPDDLDAVVLVGGSSRIPLVGELVSQELGLPVSVDTHPKQAVAKGAARHGHLAQSPAADPGPVVDPMPTAPVAAAPAAVAPVTPAPVMPAAAPATLAQPQVDATLGQESVSEAPAEPAPVRTHAAPAAAGIRPGVIALAILILAIGVAISILILMG